MQYDFEGFIASRFTNLWIKEPGLSIYVRKSVQRGLYDVANITAKKRGGGAYRAFLDRFSSRYPLRIENVIADRFADFHRRLGWAEIPCPYGVPTFLNPLAVERQLGFRPGMIFHSEADSALHSPERLVG